MLITTRCAAPVEEGERGTRSARRLGVLLGLLGLLGAGLALDSRSVQAEPPSIRFTAAGDYGRTADTAAVLDGVRAAAPDLNLALGDLSYGGQGSEDAWCDLVTSRVGAGFPFQLLAGNHESSGTQDGDINDFSACLPNQLPGLVGTYGRQWWVDHPKQDPTVRFVMISPGLTFPDGTWSYAAGSPRYQWTAAAIDGARAAGIPWVVVGLHLPCVSMGFYDCDDLQDVNDLLLAKKVDLVLNGHEHHYQRTKQLSHSAGCTRLTVDAYDADCVVDADDQLVKGAGTVIATVGTGGRPLRDVNAADAEAGYFRTWSGLNATPSFGFLDVQADADALTARFVATSGTYSDAFTISPGATPPPNTAPTAQVAVPACSALACTFDGAASTDAEGPIASYSWSFGDGTSGAGAAPAHTYAAAGTYTVTLTVTDSAGLTASATRQLTVTSAPTAASYASDAFGRTLTGSWGAADTGGAWTVSGSTTNVSVSGGAGRLVMRTAGSGQLATLPSAPTTTASDLRVALSVDKAGSTANWYVSVLGRHVPGGGDYRAKLRVQSNGTLSVSLDRATASGAETVLVPATALTGLSYAPGTSVQVRLQVSGTAPTQLRAKVWKTGTPEPATWTVTGTDATAALQTAGGYGFRTYLSGSATALPVTASFDDLVVTAAAP